VLYGKIQSNQASRFIREITDEVIESGNNQAGTTHATPFSRSTSSAPYRNNQAEKAASTPYQSPVSDKTESGAR